MEEHDVARARGRQRCLAPPTARIPTPPVFFLFSDASRGRMVALQPTGGPRSRPQASLQLEEVDVGVLLSALESSTSSHAHDQGPLPLDKRERERVLTMRRRNKYRKRVQDERKRLQEEEVELGEELAELQRYRHSALATMKWQLAATQQLTSRLMAENRQLQLREAVARHGAVIQRLRAVVLTHERSQRGNPVDQAPNPSDIADTVLLESFLLEMGAVYVQTDAVMSACGLGYTPTPLSSYYKPRRRRDDQAGEFLESKATVTLSFEYAQLSWAVWHCLRCIIRCHDCTAHLDDVEDAPNTLAMTFDLDVYQHEGQIMVLGYNGVVRRYVEPMRTVFVWRALTEGKGEYAGFYVDETGWCILQASPEPGSTLLRTCVRNVPTHLRGTGGLAATMERQSAESVAEDQFTEFTLKAWDAAMLDLMRMMETVILNGVPTADTAMVNAKLPF